MTNNENIEKIIHKSENLLNTESETKFLVLEKEIKVELLEGSYLDRDSLSKFIHSFVSATRDSDKPEGNKEEILLKMFKGEHLPGALETFNFTFKIDGMTFEEVTHYLRHREITWSARCSGDNPLGKDDILVHESIFNSKELYEEYKETCLKQKEIYKKLVDSKQVSTMDARCILPRATRQTYFASMNFRTLLGVIKQRMDRQIQPKGDNLIAYGIRDEILRIYPKIKKLNIIDIDAKNFFYINNARKVMSTNLYLPEKQNDIFEWRKDDFVYNNKRSELNGIDSDVSIFDERYLDYKNKRNG